MAIDFPTSPTIGQTFSSGSVTYTWDGTKWTALAAGGGKKIEAGNTSAEVIDTGTDGRFIVTTEGSERFRITESGFVGVGTTSPATALDVQGTITASGFSGNLANTLTLNTSGTGLSGSTTFNNSGAATFTVSSNATSSNTVSTIVARDASGNFSAGTITASSFSGNLANTLTLNTSGTGLSGSTTFNNSGAATFTVSSNATSANTGSTIVARDSSGNFSAGTITASLSGSSTSCTGNAATATNLSTTRSDWNTNGTISAVVGQLAWKNYGNNHTIFDASASTAPNGSAVNNTNAQVAWTGSYPTLMGWNGTNTYGVRVDSSRISDVTSQRSFSGDISTGGQGRFTGWYSGGAATGLATEIGVSAGSGYVLVYNRDTSTYGTLNLASSAANLQLTGGVVNVTSGALQQGGNQVLHAGNYNSYAPTLTGGNASGTWGINITGYGYPRRSDGNGITFYWSGQSGQPTWLWGSNDGTNMYVWNPSNFSVNYAGTAGTLSNPASCTAVYFGIAVNTDPGGLTSGGGVRCTVGGIDVAASSQNVLNVNRTASDGTLVSFRRNGGTQGSISVAGATVSYNQFLGGHWSALSNWEREDIKVGTILDAIDELTIWKFAVINVDGEQKKICYNGSANPGDIVSIDYEGQIYEGIVELEENEEINKAIKVKVNDAPASKAVYGIFSSWNTDSEADGGIWNDMVVGAVGNYVIRMAAGQSPQIGDLVEADGNGCGRVQDDDIIRSKTVAKITSTIPQVTYEDGSFLVCCVLYCG